MKFIKGNIYLAEDANGVSDDAVNFVNVEGVKYFLRYLNDAFKSSKGGNSSVFRVINEKTKEESVIKISTFSKPDRKTPPYIVRRYGRFIDEIKVLYELKEKGREKVIEIQFDGTVSISGREFPYYVMEKADIDLKEYILANKELDNQERVKFCINVYEAISQLHSEGYYHRDIKPDNILLFLEDTKDVEGNAVWKIGDLGLISHRDKDYDDLGEKVGPFGWLSPEAGNKFLTESSKMGFDCKIDDKSDVFQLGKLFWFIFQGNIPIGQLKNDDFICEIQNGGYIFSLIESMLSYSKPKRLNMVDLGVLLSDLKTTFAV